MMLEGLNVRNTDSAAQSEFLIFQGFEQLPPELPPARGEVCGEVPGNLWGLGCPCEIRNDIHPMAADLVAVLVHAIAGRACEIVVECHVGDSYRGISQETVLDSILEQRWVFKDADHTFMWKPKLRILDKYENRKNKVALGHFLDVCVYCSAEAQTESAIHPLTQKDQRARPSSRERKSIKIKASKKIAFRSAKELKEDVDWGWRVKDPPSPSEPYRSGLVVSSAGLRRCWPTSLFISSILTLLVPLKLA